MYTINILLSSVFNNEDPISAVFIVIVKMLLGSPFMKTLIL